MFLWKCFFFFFKKKKKLCRGGLRSRPRLMEASTGDTCARPFKRPILAASLDTSSACHFLRAPPPPRLTFHFSGYSLRPSQSAGPLGEQAGSLEWDCRSVVGSAGGRKGPPSLQSWLGVNFDPEELRCGMRGISGGPRYLIGVARL